MKKHLFSYRTFKKPLCVALCACMIIGCVSGCGAPGGVSAEKLEEWAKSLTITPSAESDGVIPENAVFTVKSSEGKLKKKQAELIKISPETALLAEEKKGELTLTPEATLPENTVINLSVADESGVRLRSWAFQTETGFSVVRTTPGDNESYTLPTGGVEVVFSYEDITEEAFAAGFSLTDSEGGIVPGRAEKHGATLVFVPQAALGFDTVYEARVSGALSTPGGKTLGEDIVFSFRTAEAEGENFYFQNSSPITETFLREDTPVIAINCDQDMKTGTHPVSVSAWRFKTGDDYYQTLLNIAERRGSTRLWRQGEQPKVDTTKLTSLGSFQSVLTVSENTWGPAYVVLPESYEYGQYYFTVTTTNPVSGKELLIHKFIQISDISVYSMQTEGDTLLWLHNSASGAPISGAEIEINSGSMRANEKSAADGVARLATPVAGGADGGWGVLKISEQGGSFIDLCELSSKQELTAEEQYYAYLYTDRPIYMSSDTIRIWGLVRPRAGAKTAPENLRVTLGDYENDLYTVPVALAEDGTFSADLSFSKLAGRETRYESIAVKCGEDETIFSRGITLGDYVKPDYTYSVTADKPFYRAGETANLTFNAAFFDGTPAHSLAAEIEIRGQPDQIKTGEDGRAVYAYDTGRMQLSPEESDSWRAIDTYYSVRNASAENDNFNFNDSMLTFLHDIALRGELTGEGAGRKLQIKTNALDFSKIKKPSDAYDEELIIGAPRDMPVSAELFRTYYTKTPRGSYYDFIEKRTVTTYDYERHEESLSATLYETKNGVLEIEDLPAGTESAGMSDGYYYVLTAADSAGKPVKETVWVSSEDYRGDGLHNYTLAKRGAPKDDYTARTMFGDKETASFDLLDNQKPVSGGSMLWSVVQDGLKSVSVENAPALSLPFDESLVPNYTIAGAYFDGKHIYTIDSISMSFDPKGRELTLSLSSDKEKYAPGESAKLGVSAVYKDTGKPAGGAAVSLSLVDEAVFAIESDSADVLERLYRTVYSASIRESASYHEYNLAAGDMGEKGGGGGDAGIRADFRDTAAFVSLTTDENGLAETEVALPDNITSWRLTAQAVSPELYAGTNTLPVVVTGRFFLNAIVPDSFLEGDSANILLRAYGTADGVTAETLVDYTVSLDDGEQIEHAGKAGEYTALPLGSLKAGQYKLTISAKTPDTVSAKSDALLQDAIEKTITVKKRGVEASVVKTFSLSEGISIEPEKFPVTLGFYNGDFALYADVLSNLLTAPGGRTDARIARRFAENRQGTLSEENYTEPEGADNFSDVISPDGEVSLFYYDSNSVPLSARVHAAVPDYLIGADQYDVFSRAIGNPESTASDVAAAYLGMAAHGQPVLSSVRMALAEAGGYSDENKLWFVAALAELGDFDGARGYYDTLVAPLLMNAENEQKHAVCYIDKGDINENLRLTALASISASLLHTGDEDGMMRYLLDNSSTEDLYLLEQIIYLNNMRPQNGEAAVSYTQGGRKKSVKLPNGGIELVKFSAEDFTTANIKAESGNVFVKASYIAAADEAERQENNEITVKKTIEPIDGGTLRVGSVAKITLELTVNENIDPAGMVIDDYIPSGMRYLDRKEQIKSEDSILVCNYREGQKISFTTYVDTYLREQQQAGQPEAGPKTYPPLPKYVYYARCAAPGDYVVESAMARAETVPIWGMSERSVVSIHE